VNKAVSFLLITCIVTISCAKKEARFKLETVDGVRVVRNLAIKPEKTAQAIKFIEDLSVGGEDGEGASLIQTPIDIDADLSGKIYILDYRDASIRQFDGNGSFIRSLGRKGQGPGEFEGPVSMEVVPNGNVIIIDKSQMRLTIIAPNGDFIKSVTLREPVSDICSGKGGILVAGYCDSPKSKNYAGTLDVETGETTALFSQAAYWPDRDMDDKRTYDFPYFVRFALDSKNRLYVGSAVAYEISVMDIHGKLELKFKKDHKRIPLQGEMLDKVSGITQKGTNPYLHNPYYPVFDSLSIDELDRVWIQHYQPKWIDRINEQTPYDIFSSDGVFLFETSIPGHVYSRLRFKNGFIYALKKAESGYLKAVRLKLEE
jgi:hypothetical protein